MSRNYESISNYIILKNKYKLHINEIICPHIQIREIQRYTSTAVKVVSFVIEHVGVIDLISFSQSTGNDKLVFLTIMF